MYTHLRKVLIPSGLKHMLEGFSRAVVRCKPISIPHFAEEYFNALLTFRAGNPNLSFDELLKEFQRSQLGLLNLKGTSLQSVHRVDSKEWEAGPLLYEARINQIGPVPMFPAADLNEAASKDAQELAKAQFLRSESIEAEIEESELDGIISANVVTLSPGPITREMAMDLAVFRRRTTPSSVVNSCGSSPTGDCSNQGSQCGQVRSALFERVPLSEIGVDVNAVLIKTSMLPNVAQIVVQSEEVPEIIVFQADNIDMTGRRPDSAFAAMEAVMPNKQNTGTTAPAPLTHCSPDTGDAMMAKMLESVELVAPRSVVESSGDQVTAETKIDSASQKSRGSASQRSSRSNITAPAFSQEEQITAEVKESASQKSSVSSIASQHSSRSNIAAPAISREEQITAEVEAASKKSSASSFASQHSSRSNIAAPAISLEKEITAQVKESASQKSSASSFASQRSSRSNIAAPAVSHEKEITAQVKESASEKSSASSIASQRSSRSNIAAPAISQEEQVTAEVKESASQKSSASSIASQRSSRSNIAAPSISHEEQITAEVKESASQKSSASSISAPSAAGENPIVKEASACESSLDCAAQKSSLSNTVISAVSLVCDGKTTVTDVADAAEAVVTKDSAETLAVQTDSESQEEEDQSTEDAVYVVSVVFDAEVSASDMIGDTSTELPASEVAMVTADGAPGSQTTLQESVISGLAIPDVLEANAEEPSPCLACKPAMAEGKTSHSDVVLPPFGAVEEPRAPMPADDLVSAGAHTIQITNLMNPLPADCAVEEDKTPASAQVNSAPPLEIRAPYLVYLPLPTMEMLTPGMVPQAVGEGEEIKASPYMCIPLITRDIPNSPGFVGATTPQLSRTGSFAGTFVPFIEAPKAQNFTQPSRPASQGHMGFSKVRRPLSNCPAGVSMAAEAAAHPSPSLQHQAGAGVTNNGQQPHVSCCSCGTLHSRPCEPMVASACPGVGSASHWRLCHLTHPGAQGGHPLACPYQPSPSMSQCGLEQIAKIPMYQDCGLYCSCHHAVRARSSCGSLRPHHMAETACSGHNLGRVAPRQGCSSEHVVHSHNVMPSATDRRYSCCYPPRHSSLVMCDHQEAMNQGGHCGGGCGLTKATTMPSCSHHSAATETCHDYRINYNL
ncbi:uncharacterized protein LOC134102640 [Sardina pilchardus]|uniref:uncharacterized protein LOC134102640 n=1 Tax=Sardina pilchardus TaxID=27697 RepID=UPI002E161B0C